jgi:5,5'-dehydrodivanillate O-demethylase
MALTVEENERLTRVGPGTPGGEMMRRYWHPVAVTVALEENPVMPVRILGEDLTLFRDRSGKLGLVGQRCAHRLVDMRFGIPEDNGLRCPYHGWAYDSTGQCIETPLESPNSRLRERISIGGYPVEELGGLIWAYLGPDPVPLLPRWDLFVRSDGFRQIIAHQLPCNWLQAMENRGDHGHAIYLHGRLHQYALERQGRLTDDERPRYNATMKRQAERLARGAYERYRSIPNEFGMTKARLDFDQDESAASWNLGTNPILFPYQLAFGPQRQIRRSYQLGVPIDDTHTWHIAYSCFVFPEGVELPKQDSVPYAEVPLKDENGEYVLDYVLGQDMVAWYSQGEITDRSRETLASTDVCIEDYRALLASQIDKVERGEVPMNVFFDATQADRPELRIPGFAEDEISETSIVAGSAGQYYRGNYHKMSPAGWLYIEDDAERYCPDRDLIIAAYAKAEELGKQRAPQAEPAPTV